MLEKQQLQKVYVAVCTSTLVGNVALLLKGSGLEKGSILVVFLKKSSDEALKGSASLNGSPPKGSATLTQLLNNMTLYLMYADITTS